MLASKRVTRGDEESTGRELMKSIFFRIPRRKIHKRHAKHELGEPVAIVNTTRLAFLINYFFVGWLVVILLILVSQGRLTLVIGGIFAGLIYLSLKYPELVRLYSYYKIMPTNVQVITGFLKKDRQKVYMEAIGRIEVYQGLWQRILDYGTVNIRSVAGDSGQDICIKNVRKPRELVVVLEKLVKLNFEGKVEEYIASGQAEKDMEKLDYSAAA